VIYQSRWVNLYVDKVHFPNGSIIEKHHLLDFDHHAVMTIAQDNDGRYLMVKVCRYTTGRTEWEFPAGGVEDGEEITRGNLENDSCQRNARWIFSYIFLTRSACIDSWGNKKLDETYKEPLRLSLAACCIES
jgi:8-oxo-dGTP pyrophosphatase MutT (NUDIX family)